MCIGGRLVCSKRNSLITAHPLITTTAGLERICKELSLETFVTVDTEFVREKTYWPVLCLVQLGGTRNAYAVDPLAKGIDLTALFALMRDPAITKVFHAAGQDLEIFLKLSGELPAPLADTQILAMVAGYGEQAGYEPLVQRIAKATIDKSNRYTDWSRRPLTEAQLNYALADVTHLRFIYTHLRREVTALGRESWIGEMMRGLENPSTYRIEPEHAWRRLKPRMDKPKFLSVLRELACWREQEAQRRDVIRGFILRDEALNEIAAVQPDTKEKLARVRGLSDKAAKGSLGTRLLELIDKGVQRAASDPLRLPARPKKDPGSGFIGDMLKVLLKARAEENRVAVKLIASSAEIDDFVTKSTDRPVPFLSGWRYDIFGKEAQALVAGELAMSVKNNQLHVEKI